MYITKKETVVVSLQSNYMGEIWIQKLHHIPVNKSFNLTPFSVDLLSALLSTDRLNEMLLIAIVAGFGIEGARENKERKSATKICSNSTKWMCLVAIIENIFNWKKIQLRYIANCHQTCSFRTKFVGQYPPSKPKPAIRSISFKRPLLSHAESKSPEKGVKLKLWFRGMRLCHF